MFMTRLRGITAITVAVLALLAAPTVEAQTDNPEPSVNICARTEQVRSALLAQVTATNCAAVSGSELAAITSLNLKGSYNKYISSLQAHDFDGLTSLTTLSLYGNQLGALPAGVFAGLTSLTTLNLRFSGLTSLPAGVFADLTSLPNLDLTNNDLTSLPAGVFGDLTSLTTLSLRWNDLTSLPAGVFADLTSLTNLDLTGNDLTALPAGVFADLTSLTTLDLHDNRLAALPAGAFAGLTSLTTLDLHDNNLTALPVDGFVGLTSLRTLNLHFNSLTALPAGVFADLTSLRTLNLRVNPLRTLPAGVFANLTSLRTLNLRVNPLRTLPAGVFANLSSLRTLDLRDNYLRTLPTDVFADLSSLTTLHLNNPALSPYLLSPLSNLAQLNGSDYTRPAPPGAPTALTATVRAGSIELHWTAPATGTPTSYQILRQAGDGPQAVYVEDTYDTGRAAVTYIDPDVTDGVTYQYQVKALNAGGAGAGSAWAVAVVDICGRTEQVQSALLAAVTATDCAAVSISEVAALTTLDLSSTSLSALQAGDFAGLTGLTTLDLPSTLDSASYSPHLLSPLTSLTQLDGAVYTRPSAPGTPTALTGTFSAGQITLSWTAPATGTPTSYRIWRQTDNGPLAVYVADTYGDDGTAGTYTDTGVTEGETYWYQVQALNAGGASAGSNVVFAAAFVPVNICNRTKDVRQALLARVTATDCALVSASQLAAITSLDLSGKYMISLQAHDFAGLTGLTELDLSLNRLGTLPAGVFADLVNLTHLDLDLAGLSSLPAGVFDTLTNLTHLDLCLNGLKTLPTGLFDHLPNLSNLELYSNRLRTLPAGIFDHLPNLLTLYLYKNDLIELPAGVFDHLPNLTDLRLDKNELTELPAGIFDHLPNLTTLFLILQGPGLGIVYSDYLSYSPYLLSPLTSLERLGYGSYTRPAPPGVPTGLTATVRAGGIELSWTAPVTTPPSSGRPTSYRIWRQVGSGESAVYIADTYDTGRAAVTYTDPDVTVGRTYSYQVQALNAGGASATSGVASVLMRGQVNICDHTAPVRTALLAAVSATACADVELSELEALTTLDLSSTSLATVRAGDFIGLTGLTTLNLSDNALTTLPADIFADLTGLTTLDLSGNALTALPAAVFADLSGLTTLDLSDNSLTTLPTDIFSGLSSLTTLDLRTNPALSYSPHLLSPLTSLTQLDGAAYTPPAPPGAPTGLTATIRPGGIALSWTAPATGVPTSYRLWRQVGTRPQAVYVADTAASGGLAVAYTDTGITVGETYTYQAQALNAGGASAKSNRAQAELTAIVDICDRTAPVQAALLAAVHTTGCTPFSAIKLAEIPILDLSGQHMRALQAGDFAGMPGLTALNLREAELESLAAGVFDNLSSLTTLDLHDNRLEALPAGVFADLSSLTTLDLSDNLLSGLPAGVFDNLSSLTTLDLGDNDLGTLLPGVFGHTPGLVTLRLNDNMLTSLPAGVFDSLSSLTTLDLSGTALTSLPVGVFDNLTSLTTLDLSSNALTSLPAGVFDQLTSLTTLRLNNNRRNNQSLSYSPHLLSPLTSLTQLDGAAYTPPAPPGAPTGLTATIRAGGIVLSWTAPVATSETGAPTSYRLWRAAGSGEPAVYVADTYAASRAAVTYTDLSVTDGVTYTYQVQALNAGGVSAKSATGAVTVTHRTLQITSAESFAVNEGTTAVTTLTAADSAPSGDPLTWSIPSGAAGGADGAAFTLAATTGQLAFRAAKDYEAPDDATGGGTYEVIVQVAGGGAVARRRVTVTVQNVEEPGVITLSAGQPQEKQALRATLTEPDGAVADMTWAWAQAATATGPWTPVPGATSSGTLAARYTPQVRDVNQYLRVTAAYTDGHGPGKAAEQATNTPVQAAPAVVLLLSAEDHTLREGETSQVRAWLRHGRLSEELRVEVVAAAGAAAGPDDFTLNGTTLTIPADQRTSEGMVTLTAVDNDRDEPGPKEVLVSGMVTNPLVTAPTAVTLTIMDDDPPQVVGPATVPYSERAAHESRRVARYRVTTPAGTRIRWSVFGSDATAFSIDPTTGVLRFTDAALPDFEDPTNPDKEYTLTVRATDTSLPDEPPGTLAVTVRVEDAPGTVTAVLDAAAGRGTPLTVTLTDDPDDLAASDLTWVWEGSADQHVWQAASYRHHRCGPAPVRRPPAIPRGRWATICGCG